MILRRCQAGEATDNSASTANELSYSCRACLSPLFSMYPAATTCSQCASLPANSWSVCNGPAVVPADGFFQSHPRSPVVSLIELWAWVCFVCFCCSKVRLLGLLEMCIAKACTHQ